MGKAQKIARPDGKGKVVVGYLNPGQVSAEFHESLLDLLVYDMATERHIVNGGGRLGVRSGPNISGARNGVVRRFLDESNAEWLWWLDADMTFAPNTLARLLEHADAERAPIVGGLCFSIDKTQLFPTLYDFAEIDGKSEVVRYSEWPPNAMFQIAATGTACLLVHRSVFTRMEEFTLAGGVTPPGFSTVYPWFQEREFAGKAVGEDITFCWRAGLLEIPVFVNTAVHIGHVKDQLLTIDRYLGQRAELAALAAPHG